MKAIFNRIKKNLPIAVITFFTLLSCSTDELQIQQDFSFEAAVMPVPSEIAKGGTAEIRVTIHRNGSYTGAKYFIRYFQYEGHGTLRYSDDPEYLPNDTYGLASEQFRLYYTSASSVSQSFDIWISDNFGNEKKLSFQFNNTD